MPRAYSASTSSGRSGSPARFTVVTPAGMPPLFSSAAMAEGTVLISRTWSANAERGRASALSATITRPPRQSGTNSS